jgi:hypothetical protein
MVSSRSRKLPKERKKEKRVDTHDTHPRRVQARRRPHDDGNLVVHAQRMSFACLSLRSSNRMSTTGRAPRLTNQRGRFRRRHTSSLRRFHQAERAGGAGRRRAGRQRDAWPRRHPSSCGRRPGCTQEYEGVSFVGLFCLFCAFAALGSLSAFATMVSMLCSFDCLAWLVLSDFLGSCLYSIRR